MDSSGSSSQSTSTSYIPIQKEWLTKALELYGPQLGKNENIYPGDTVTPFTSLQQSLVGDAQNFLGAFTNPKSVGTPLFNETGQALSGILSGQTGAEKLTPEQVSKYFTETIQNPATKYLKETVLPLTDEGYAGGNFFSTARGKARDKMVQDTSDTLNQQRSQLEFDVLQQNQALDEAKAGRTLSAIPQAMQYGQMPAQETLNNLQIVASQIQGMKELFGFGSAEQTQQQIELQADIAKFAERNQLTDPANLEIILKLLGMNYSSSYETKEEWSAGMGRQWLTPGLPVNKGA
jgi:hypothetical protein